MKENSFEYNDEGTNKENNEQILVYDLEGDQTLRYMEKDELSQSEITINVGECKTSKEVFSQLSQMSNIFDKDEKNDYQLWLKDSNKKIFWLKVDDKLYIKFDSFIKLDGDLLSSMHYRINDDNKQLKPRLPVVSCNKDCIFLQFNNLIKDGDKIIYTYDDSKIFHFHKNEEEKNQGKLVFYKEGSNVRYFRTKDHELKHELYRLKNTYLRNIGNVWRYKRSYLPISLCGINVTKDDFGGPSCLCGTGCCSPYGIMDKEEVMDLAKDIFPLFNLKNANNENEEKIV